MLRVIGLKFCTVDDGGMWGESHFINYVLSYLNSGWPVVLHAKNDADH